MRRQPFKRATRVAERVREELMDILIRGLLRDPRTNGAVVSTVQLTDDLSIAHVYLRKPGEELALKEQAALVAAFEKAQGFLRKMLGERLKAKRIPELRFRWDDGVDRATRLDQIFMTIEQERGSGDGGGSQ